MLVLKKLRAKSYSETYFLRLGVHTEMLKSGYLKETFRPKNEQNFDMGFCKTFEQSCTIKTN